MHKRNKVKFVSADIIVLTDLNEVCNNYVVANYGPVSAGIHATRKFQVSHNNTIISLLCLML